MNCSAYMTAEMYSPTCSFEITPPQTYIAGDSKEKKIFKMIMKQYELDCVTQDQDYFCELENMQKTPPLIVHYYHPSDPINRFVWRFKTLKFYRITIV